MKAILARNLRMAAMIGFCLLTSSATPPSANVPLVGPGYEKTVAAAEGVGFREMEILEDVRSKLPPATPLTVGAIWEHLNARLKEKNAPLKVVFQTDLDHQEAEKVYFRRPITRVYDHEVKGDALRTALTDANCWDLVNVIEENAGLSGTYCKEVIILTSLPDADKKGSALLTPANVPFVPQGYDETVPRIKESVIASQQRLLENLPSKLPPLIPLTVGALWEHLNKRLKEEKAPVKLVFQTNLHRLHADKEFLNNPITECLEGQLKEDEMRKRLTDANCLDLFNAIIWNCRLHVLDRKGVIILTNYILAE